MVTGGGLSPDGSRWISCRPRFFLPVRVLSRLSRRLFLQHLEKAFAAGQLQFFSSLEWLRQRQAFLRHLVPTCKVDWVIYAKRPFAGREQVLDYVGGCTDRVALSNNRLLDIQDGHVYFRWKDYRDQNQQRTMRLTAEEFIRRFLLHVLPEGFQRIRYYGLLGNRYREQKLGRCRELWAWHSRRLPRRSPPRITATVTSSSPDLLCGDARSACARAWLGRAMGAVWPSCLLHGPTSPRMLLSRARYNTHSRAQAAV